MERCGELEWSIEVEDNRSMLVASTIILCSECPLLVVIDLLQADLWFPIARLDSSLASSLY